MLTRATRTPGRKHKAGCTVAAQARHKAGCRAPQAQVHPSRALWATLGPLRPPGAACPPPAPPHLPPRRACAAPRRCCGSTRTRRGGPCGCTAPLALPLTRGPCAACRAPPREKTRRATWGSRRATSRIATATRTPGLLSPSRRSCRSQVTLCQERYGVRTARQLQTPAGCGDE